MEQYSWIEEVYLAIRMLDMAKNMAPNTKLWAAHIDAAVAELRMERGFDDEYIH